MEASKVLVLGNENFLALLKNGLTSNLVTLL